MSRRFVSRSVVALLSLVVAACTMSPVYTSRLNVRPSQPFVAQRIARPLYVVLDPAQVPDEYTIPAHTFKALSIYQIRIFVARDLRRALEAYFEHVAVVAPTAQIPEGALVAQVRIDEFSEDGDVTGPHGRMTWAFAIRRPGDRDLAFSYAESVLGTAAAGTSYASDEMLESTYRVALEHLAAKLDQPDVLAKLAGDSATASQ
jgi:hypothetical protein